MQTPDPLPLLREEVLTASSINDDLARVLLWLVWLSLLSAEDLARCIGSKSSIVRRYLDDLERAGLVDHVNLSESGGKSQNTRYYVTDLGLYVLAERQPQPISVAKLVRSYPVTRADLLARLASSAIHRTLASLISSLIAECPSGSHITSYQQPWKERYRTLAKRGHLFSCDAAFLLQTPEGDQHAFYVRVDQPERLMSHKAEKRFLTHLFDLRDVARFQGAPLPLLLLLSCSSRYPFWAHLFDEMPRERGTSPLHAAIADMERVATAVYGPHFLPLDNLVARTFPLPYRTLLDLLDRPATPALIERFSQYFTFRHVLMQRGAQRRTQASLPRYVGDSIQAEVDHLAATTVSDRGVLMARVFHHEKGERIHMAALLSLLLSSAQKSILAHLVRHPYLSEDDLLVLLRSGSTKLQWLREQLDPLVDMKLVQRILWKEAPSSRDYRRYWLTEAGLRYVSARHQLSPASYLSPVVKQEDRRTLSPLASNVIWTQRGGKLLRRQLAHTSGLYSCIRSMYAHQRAVYTIAFWKSAREAVLWYRDPLSGLVVFPRPDAEIFYQLRGEQMPRSVLIEYDHGTTFFREYAAKFEGYSEYQYVTNMTLPPILVILHRPQSQKAMEEAIREVGASQVRIVIANEQEVYENGLLPFFDELHGNTCIEQIVCYLEK